MLNYTLYKVCYILYKYFKTENFISIKFLVIYKCLPKEDLFEEKDSDSQPQNLINILQVN